MDVHHRLWVKFRSLITRSETFPADDPAVRDVNEQFSVDQEEGKRDLVNALAGAAALFVRLHRG